MVITWIWDITHGTDPGDMNSVDVAYSPECDPTTNPDFPDGCSMSNLAALGKTAPQGASCLGSGLAIGAVPGDKGDYYANEISNIYYVKAAGLGSGIGSLYGWVYQTPGDGWYFQPNLSVQVSGGVAVASVGVTPGTPWVHINSIGPADLVNGLNTAAGVMGVALPLGFAKAVSSVKLRAEQCWLYPWDGRAVASKRRS